MAVKIYLAGPINGCTDDEAITWRQIVKDVLGEENCIDPMRRDYRGYEMENVMELVEADMNDIHRSTVVLANCWTPSWGTAMEIHFAYLLNLPVISIVPPEISPSPWLLYHSLVLSSLGDALDTIQEWFPFGCSTCHT